MCPRTEPRIARAAALCALLVATGRAAAAAPSSAAQIMHEGTAQIPACVSCHGASGEGMTTTRAPRLAGLPATYLLAQLNSFSDGSRQNVTMAPVSLALSPDQRAQLAQLYAAQRGPTQPPIGSAGAGNDGLALHGRWAQQIPACVQCHGERGVGMFPPLAGQSAEYIIGQLRAFKDGTRHSDALGLMHGIAAKLSDADVEAAASYFAARPAPAGKSSARADALPGSTPSTAGGAKAIFQPSDAPIPDDPFGQVIKLGRDVFENPRKYAARYVGNDLRCSSCHLDAGRHVGSAPMWAAYVSYPAWRAKNGHVNTFAERLQGCFLYSMNGRAPPLGDPVLVALESYSYWMARGAPVDPNIPGRGYTRVGKPALAPDSLRGARLYESRCALCHGPTGAGARDDGGAPLFPALWGGNSYNWGAGMEKVSNAAAFIKGNMPFSQGDTLTDQEAWDVAWFVDSHERPQDPRYSGSVAQTRALYHDGADSLYGTVVDGYLLGSKAVAPGGHLSPERIDGKQR
jgi:thiosulfate dehydrogenase